MLPSVTFSLKLSAWGITADIATFLRLDFNDSATFMMSSAILPLDIFENRSFAPTWKM